MKKRFIFSAFVLSCIVRGSSQQAFTERIVRRDETNKAKPLVDNDGKISFADISTFGIYGIGNINTEVLNNLNSSGKISGFIRPQKGTNSFTTVNFAFNKNATNTDTLLASTLLFPDIGSNSFLGTAMYSLKLFRKKTLNGVHLLSPFYEFSTKNIKREEDDVNLRFTTINHVVGARYSFMSNIDNDDVVFSIAGFFAVANIADQDTADFRRMFDTSTLPSAINSVGLKVSFQYNNFQAFADLRHVTGKLPVRSLRGFNSNVGIVFNAEIFER